MLVSSPLLSRGVVRVDINLEDVDIDQCSTDGWFAGTHRCNLTTMEVSVPKTPTQIAIDFSSFRRPYISTVADVSG